MKNFFKKITLAITSLALVLVAGLTLASCASGIKGSLNLTIYRTVVEVEATFDSNVKLDESSTKVTAKLYNSSDEYQSTQTISLKSYVGSATFEDLTENTKYIMKLYVTYGGYEELMDSKEFTTKNDGTDVETAIEISSVADFLKMTEDKDAYYKLTCDLDFSNESSVGIFTGSSEAFAGTFDGQGHTIKNVKLAGNEYSGLFEFLNEGTIKDLTLDTVSLSVTSTVKYLGALYGYAVDSTISNVTVKNVSFSNSSSITTSNSNFACFAGYSESTKVTDCTLVNGYLNLTDVRPSSSYNSSIGSFFATVSGNSTVTNAVSTAQVLVTTKSTGKIYVGGFAGSISSGDLISNSTFRGIVNVSRTSSTTDSLFVGGFGGASSQGPANLDNCMAIADISVLAETGDVTTTTLSIAKKLYVGGIMGNVASTQIGVTNSSYLPLNTGIKVLNLAPTEDSTSASAGVVSLTFGKIQSSIASKVTGNVALADGLTVYGPNTAESTIDATKLTSEVEASRTEAKEICYVNLDVKQIEALFTTTTYTAATTKTIKANYNTTVTVTVAEGATTLAFADGVLTITPTANETSETLTVTVTYGTNTKTLTFTIVALLAATE